MSPPVISIRVAKFLIERIDSVPQLESLLLLWKSPMRAWTAQEIATPIDLSLTPEGEQSATIALLSTSGQVLTSTDVVFDVPGADLLLTETPVGTLVTAGEDIELAFAVRNDGSAAATAVISVTLGEAIDESQSLWLAGGDEGIPRPVGARRLAQPLRRAHHLLALLQGDLRRQEEEDRRARSGGAPRPSPVTVREILQRSASWLAGKGFESARLEAELLLAHVLEADRITLYTDGDRPLIEDEVDGGE